MSSNLPFPMQRCEVARPRVDGGADLPGDLDPRAVGLDCEAVVLVPWTPYALGPLLAIPTTPFPVAFVLSPYTPVPLVLSDSPHTPFPCWREDVPLTPVGPMPRTPYTSTRFVASLSP